ncbi:MAG: hypothetical protein ACLFUB_20330 [Cyclobacteriaceae bacterium]
MPPGPARWQNELDFFYEERTIGTDNYVLIPEFSSQVDLTRSPARTDWQNGGFFTMTNYVYEADIIILNLSYRINQSSGK